ncbi:amino acid adenylation domain-containing protein [Paracoccus chinensis]|uniref:Enterobactin synthetase component F n=1 Tax=Paracoccus chinensis TaxID=525640 RepID=A0A1G9KMU3_9RHOB|nr:amino acid adenylation domain-containing protein [Paracoccus chinensis]SDL50777.1 enterobactin synthetase component F [Paracoccus chinensis]
MRAMGGTPLTEAQEGLWYFQALDPSNPILNTGQYLDLHGPLDEAALREAVARTIAESEALRLRFRPVAGGAMQVLGEPPELEWADLSDHADPEAEALCRMAEDSARPLDLAAEPVAAFSLYRLGPDRHLLYERIHHLALDGYGMVLVTNRIGDHYSALVNGTSVPVPFPPLSRADEADAAYRASPKRAEDAAWWRAAMQGMPEVTGPAPGRAVSGATFLRESRWLPSDLLAVLAEWSDAQRLNWTDVLTALTGAYLSRWTGGEVVAGLPFMVRMGRPIARVPCMAMNVLPQRIRPDEDALLADWIAPLAAEMREARRHGLYRSEQLRRDLGLIGGARRLYGPLINVQPFDRPPGFAGLEVGLHILGAGAVDDLTLTFRGDPISGMLFEVDANPGLYSPEDVAGHAARLPAFLSAALAQGRLAPVPTATADEIASAKALTAAAVHSVPDTTLTALIEAQMEATPEAPALVFGDVTLSYADLDRRSAVLAGRLAELGAGPETIVAVALDRSLELSIALVAILRAGAAYLPLDPDHPPERLARILDRAAPVVLLTSPELAGRFPDFGQTDDIADSPASGKQSAGLTSAVRSAVQNAARPRMPQCLLTSDWPQEGTAPATPPQPGNMAYVIYTSGSTGEPKGVVIEHRAIVNRLLWMRDHYGFTPRDRILQKTPATFDVSVWEFFLPCISGATLVMAPPGAHRDPTLLAGEIRSHGITTAHFVPSMLSAFLAAPASGGIRMARVFCSGEELTAELRDRFHARVSAELHNLYGPTEAAVDVSYWPAAPDDASNPLPIGWPVWNTRLAVLDVRGRPVPPGLPGNLYLGGVQLARGYLGRDDLTAERFVTGPDGQRLYATGDLARLRHDGAVIYLGRSDHQVKIRGLRIELGEIEAAIMGSGLAREAVVLAREEGGDKRLVAYVVPQGRWSEQAVAAHLEARLPAYMVPQAWVVLDALPVTSNGKLDRKSLPAPVFAAAGRAAETAAETLLASLYAEILTLPEPPPAEADFFALGGDSLSAVRLSLRIEEETGRDPGLGAIFEHPVIAALARVIEGGATTGGLSPLLLLAEGDPAQSPLFLVHPAGGLGWGYRRLAHALAPARRVWAIQHPGLDPDQPLPESLSALAADYARRIAGLVPEGPVHLAGWSVGGVIAQELASALADIGLDVGMVAALDSYPADVWRAEPDPDPVSALRALLAIAGHDPEAHTELDTREKVVGFLKAGDTPLGALPEQVLDSVVRVVTDTSGLVRRHHHRPHPGRLTHVRAGLGHGDRHLTAELWRPHGEVEALEVPFLHPRMISPEAVVLIAPMLKAAMDRAEQRALPQAAAE